MRLPHSGRFVGSVLEPAPTRGARPLACPMRSSRLGTAKSRSTGARSLSTGTSWNRSSDDLWPHPSRSTTSTTTGWITGQRIWNWCLLLNMAGAIPGVPRRRCVRSAVPPSSLTRRSVRGSRHAVRNARDGSSRSRSRSGTRLNVPKPFALVPHCAEAAWHLLTSNDLAVAS